MIAAPRHDPASSLLRFALLAAVLAGLAGLLGMHVFVGAHGTHASATHSATGEQAAPAASAHLASDHSRPAAHSETPEPPSCGCGGACGEQQAAHGSCTPAPSGASLSAPPPGTALLAVQPRVAPAADLAPTHSHLPATPTPRELSISRT